MNSKANSKASTIEKLCERYPAIQDQLMEMCQFVMDHPSISREVMAQHFTDALDICERAIREKWNNFAVLSSPEQEETIAFALQSSWYDTTLATIKKRIEIITPDAPPVWPKIVFNTALRVKAILLELRCEKIFGEEINSEKLQKRTANQAASVPSSPFAQNGTAKIPTGAPMVVATQSFINKWQSNKSGYPCYRFTFRSDQQQKRYIETYIIDPASTIEEPAALQGSAAWELVNRFGVMHAYIHLLLGAYAMQQPNPWQGKFQITGQNLSQSLHLHKRRTDLSVAQRLRLLVQICKDIGQVGMDIYWPGQGRDFSVMQSRVWHMDFRYNGQYRLYDPKVDLTDFTVYVTSGAWAEKFLNPDGNEKGLALFQYGVLTEKILLLDPVRDERLVRLALHIMFSARMRQEPRTDYTVPEILSVLFSEEKLERANTDRRFRSQVTEKFHRDLLMIKERLDFQVTFPDSFPSDLLPVWAKRQDIVNSEASQLTMQRNYWPKLLEQKICISPPVIAHKHLPAFRKQLPSPTPTPEAIRAAREAAGLSLSGLAAKIGLSKSWAQGIEAGRLKIQPDQLTRLKTILKL